MRQGALLVNAARGPIVDTDALVDALNAAAFAPRSTSPIPSHCPRAIRCGAVPICCSRLTSAGSSPQFAPRAVKRCRDELRRYISGEPLHNVVQAAI